jgi:hypothetical protein
MQNLSPSARTATQLQDDIDSVQELVFRYYLFELVGRSTPIALLLGGLLPSVGGGLLGLLRSADIFFEFELAGTILLFIGFVLSMRYLSKSSGQPAVHQKPDGLAKKLKLGDAPSRFA